MIVSLSTFNGSHILSSGDAAEREQVAPVELWKKGEVEKDEGEGQEGRRRARIFRNLCGSYLRQLWSAAFTAHGVGCCQCVSGVGFDREVENRRMSFAVRVGCCWGMRAAGYTPPSPQPPLALLQMSGPGDLTGPFTHSQRCRGCLSGKPWHEVQNMIHNQLNEVTVWSKVPIQSKNSIVGGEYSTSNGCWLLELPLNTECFFCHCLKWY